MYKPERHDKGWGYEDWIVNKKEYCGKILIMMGGKKNSLHYHKKKDETFYIRSGYINLIMNGIEIRMQREDTIHIPAGVEHRMEALVDSEIIEISTFHSEDDVVRIEKGD